MKTVDTQYGVGFLENLLAVTNVNYMDEDFLEELRKSFIEAIAAHKFIEMRYHRNQTDEINRLKRRWNEIKKRLTTGGTQVNLQKIYKFNNPELELENKLSLVESELESIKIKLLEQQKITSQILNQVEKQLAEIKLIRQTEDEFSVLESYYCTSTDAEIEFDDLLSNLKLQMSLGLSSSQDSKHQDNSVVDAEFDSLRKQLDEM
jgi:Fe2+ transport system protein B